MAKVGIALCFFIDGVSFLASSPVLS